jgi:hypothetical protein
VILLVLGCAQEPVAEPAPEPTPEVRVEAPPEDAVRLGVPAETIHRARLEARGLARLSASLRGQALESGRTRSSPTYAELRADADAHHDARVSFDGRVGLVRPAGPGLFIIALSTRQDGARWRDPLYVLSVVPPEVPEGGLARVDGWVVGERTIGRHALPLVMVFHVEPVP